MNNQDVINISINVRIILMAVIRPHFCLVPEVRIIQTWFIT